MRFFFFCIFIEYKRVVHQNRDLLEKNKTEDKNSVHVNNKKPMGQSSQVKRPELRGKIMRPFVD